MRRATRLLALAFLWPALAGAIPPGWLKRPSPVVLSIKFSTPGCFASGSATGTKGEPVPTARASVAENTVSGSPVSCANDQFRVSEFGLLVEPQAGQYATTPDAPITETVALPVSPGFYGYSEGSGTMAITAGTAVTTGLPCTVSGSSPCIFAVTTGGTVTWTRSGTVSFFNVTANDHNPGFRTSRMHAAGVTVRRYERVSPANPVTASPACWALMGVTPFADGSWARTTVPFTVGTYGAANSADLFVSSGYLNFDTFDGVGAQKRIQHNIGHWADGSTHDIVACVDAGCAMTLWVDGFVAPLSSTSGSGACTTFGSPLTLGASSSPTYALGGYLSQVNVCKTANPGACAGRGPRMQPFQAAALGDSITAGFGVTTSYPATLQTQLAGTWKIANQGLAGDTTTMMLVRWYSTIKRQAPGTLVLLGGTNDLGTGVSAAATWANLLTMYLEARSLGMRLVPVTVLPRNGSGGWDGTKEAQRQLLNAQILAWCSANGVTCVDAAADMDDGSGALKAAYRQADLLHPNQAGADRLATLVRAAFP